jgi:hypothetical protein
VTRKLPIPVLGSLMLAGCGLLRASSTPPQPPAPEAWARAVAVAAAQVGAGRYSAADRMLVDFAAQYAGTPQAAMATVHRALYKADPMNPTATVRDATMLLDSLLTLPLDSAARSDARVMRRLTSALERAAAAVASNGAGSSTTASSSDSSSRSEDPKARDDEVQRLRNELAKANAELERIKKRVAQPKP